MGLTDSDIDQIYTAFISPTRMVDGIGSFNAKMNEEIEHSGVDRYRSPLGQQA